MLAVVMMFASASADWVHSSGNPCFVTPVDGVVTAAQVTAALANQADPTVFPTNAFNSCNDLVTITLPTSITSFGNAVFANAMNLAGTVIIPEGVTYIGKFTFQNNAQLQTVIFPASLERINNRVWPTFLGCTSLTTVCGATFSGVTDMCTYQNTGTSYCRAANGGETGLVTGQQYDCAGSNSNCLMGDSTADFASLTSACPADLYPATTTTTSVVSDVLGRSDVDDQEWNGANTITNTNPCTPDDNYANCGCEHASCSMQTHESLGRVVKTHHHPQSNLNRFPHKCKYHSHIDTW